MEVMNILDAPMSPSVLTASPMSSPSGVLCRRMCNAERMMLQGDPEQDEAKDHAEKRVDRKKAR